MHNTLTVIKIITYMCLHTLFDNYPLDLLYILITNILIKVAEGMTEKDIGFIMTMIIFYISFVIYEKVFLKDWKQIINIKE